MPQIFRIPIEDKYCQLVYLYSDAEILSATYYGGSICLWVLANPRGVQIESYNIFVLKEGMETEFKLAKFIDTVVCNQFVWHIFASKLR